MPIYLYKCGQGHKVEIVHGVGQVLASACSVCGGELRRVFTTPNVKRSSFIEPSPAIKRFLDTTGERRAKYEEKKASRHE